MTTQDLYARLLSTEQRIENCCAAEFNNLSHSANAMRFGGRPSCTRPNQIQMAKPTLATTP